MIELKIDFQAELEILDYLDSISQQTMRLQNFPHVDDVVFAIHEALINAIEAVKDMKNDQRRKIIFVLKVCSQQAEVQIVNCVDDRVELLNLNNKKTMEQIALHKEGRGLLFIQHLMDEVWQKSNVEGEVTLFFRKRA